MYFMYGRRYMEEYRKPQASIPMILLVFFIVCLSFKWICAYFAAPLSLIWAMSASE